jgi:hypothetical protein
MRLTRKEREMHEAFEKGRDVFGQRPHRTANPYEPGSDLSKAFKRGYDQAAAAEHEFWEYKG